MIPTKSLIAAFAPTGKLRASINLGNPILANKDDESGQPYGVSVDLANELARRLGLGIELLEFDGAAKSVQAVREERADIGFFAIDPARSEGIGFAPPYVVIEGSYLVPAASPIHSNDEVDRPGQRVAVGGGSAYDLFLSRTLRHAEIVRAPTSQAVVDTFLEQGLDVAAGVRQQLEADAARVGGVRLLEGRFMAIHQAVGLPQGRGGEALEYLSQFVEELKSGGFVANALALHKVKGAAVAPPGHPANE